MPDNHPVFHLGKLPAVSDSRNLLMASVAIPKKVATPDRYSIDDQYPGIRLQMLDNDRYGNCVVAEEYNHLQHMKLIETGNVVPITAKEVDAQYFLETHNQDIGLELLPNLKRERSIGVRLNGRIVKIEAFAQVNPGDQLAVRQGVYSGRGLKVGLRLPISAQTEMNAGRDWSQIAGPGTIPGTWGGHCVYVQGYTKDGPTCITWGRIQHMTWAWLRKFCDEMYTVFDHLDTPKTKKQVDVKAIRAFLEKV